METTIRNISSITPDPERSERNLKFLFEVDPFLIDKASEDLTKIALLFSYSQFLADYCIRNPEILYEELNNISKPLKKEEILSSINPEPLKEKKEILRFLRNIRNRFYLRLTLRNITGITDTEESMYY